MKKRVGIMLALCFIVGMECTGCNDSAAQEQQTALDATQEQQSDIVDTQGQAALDVTDNSESTVEVSLIQQYNLDILPVVCVEAGIECLSTEMFFESYSGQEITLYQELTKEQLAECGATYMLPVSYQGYELEIEVDVIDTIAPTIVKINDILIKVGDSISYKKAVEISDNSSNKLQLNIDNSAVDAETPGEYTVIYTVTDAGGNSASVEAKLTVVEAESHTEEDVRDLALKVIDKVVDEAASDYDNALALFKWVRNNVRYQFDAGDRSSVWAGAYEGLNDNKGDCFAYYATYSVLLTYAGIPNECVARVSDSSHHWWNLVNVGDGWYHCDTSPRRTGDGYYCFMQTDAQVAAYTKAYPEKPDYYTFDGSLLPERETTIIYGYDPDTIYEKFNTDAIKKKLAEEKAVEEQEAEENPEEEIPEDSSKEEATEEVTEVGTEEETTEKITEDSPQEDTSEEVTEENSSKEKDKKKNKKKEKKKDKEKELSQEENQ